MEWLAVISKFAPFILDVALFFMGKGRESQKKKQAFLQRVVNASSTNHAIKLKDKYKEYKLKIRDRQPDDVF